MQKTKLPKKIACKRCKKDWTPRVEVVRVCPYCKSPYFDVEPKPKPKDKQK